MSNALVKQSLGLFDDDTVHLPLGVKKKKKSTDPMKQISTKKRGVKRELDRLKKQQQKNKQQKSKKQWNSKDHHWILQDIDYTEESVKALQRLERIKATDPGMAETIVDHHQKTVSRVRKRPKEKEKIPDKSAFSEDDFNKFMDDIDFK